jgi:hypothetical protein
MAAIDTAELATPLFDRAGSAINSSSTRGTTCQHTPNLSLSQPHCPSLQVVDFFLVLAGEE